MDAAGGGAVLPDVHGRVRGGRAVQVPVEGYLDGAVHLGVRGRRERRGHLGDGRRDGVPAAAAAQLHYLDAAYLIVNIIDGDYRVGEAARIERVHGERSVKQDAVAGGQVSGGDQAGRVGEVHHLDGAVGP